jgi:hypothetical protein
MNFKFISLQRPSTIVGLLNRLVPTSNWPHDHNKMFRSPN